MARHAIVERGGSDDELLARYVADRDEESFRALVERWGSLAWQVCVRVAGNRHDAEDAFQQVLLTFARKAGQIRRAESLGSWLYGVAYRTSLHARQRRRRRDEVPLENEELAAVADRDPAAECLDQEQWDIVHAELTHLPGKYREPLVRRYLRGDRLAEISAALELSPTALKGRLQRARSELRRRLAARGIVPGLLTAAFVDWSRTQASAHASAALIAARGATAAAGAGLPIKVIGSGSWQFLTKEYLSMTTWIEAMSVVACAVGLTLFGAPERTIEARAPQATAAVHAKDTAPRAAPALVARRIADEAKTLRYGDATADGKKSMAGAGPMIHFDAAGDKTVLAGIELHGARYGTPQAPREDFKIYVLGEDLGTVLHTELVPYERFERGESKWVALDFKKPVTVPQSFWVVVDFNAAPTKGVYVSYDTSTAGEHSRVGLPGGEAKKTPFGGDWMIRAKVRAQGAL